MNDCTVHRGSRYELGHSVNLSRLIFTIPRIILDLPKKSNSGEKKKVLVEIIYLELAVSPQLFLPLVK